MTDRRRHRGPHPEDRKLFAPDRLPVLRQAVVDLSWLLQRDYASVATLKLVGDRFQLEKRQRMAVMRAAAPDGAAARRDAARVLAADVAGQTLHLDGFNVLTTVESALAGGVLLRGRDGALRDLASVHGTFRLVEESRPAAGLVGRQLQALGVASCRWLLDEPVSNSGRLRALLEELAREEGWRWDVELVPSPDPLLAREAGIVCTSDSWILDRCSRWFDAAAEVVARQVPDAWCLDLAGPPAPGEPPTPPGSGGA